MKYSSRFFLYAPLGAFLLLLAAAGVYWWILASHLSARLDAMNGHEIMPGVTVSFASHETDGFPFTLDTTLKNVTLTVATPHGPARWRTAEFAMHALTYGRDETIFEAAGPQSLTFTRGSDTHTLPFAVGSLHASALMKRGALARFDLDLVGFGAKAFTAQRLQFHIRRNGGDRLQLFVAADDVRAPAGSCPRLGAGLMKARLAGSFTKAGAFSTLLAGSQDLASAEAGWRATGGLFETSELTLSPKAAALQTALRGTPVEEWTSVAGLTRVLCGVH